MPSHDHRPGDRSRPRRLLRYAGLPTVVATTLLGLAAPSALAEPVTGDATLACATATGADLGDAIWAANLVGGTITLTGSGTIALDEALPDLTGNVTITGSGADQCTVGRDLGEGPFRIFTVQADASVTISGLTIKNGETSDAEGGGGVYNAGSLNLDGVWVTQNKAFGATGTDGTWSSPDGGNGSDAYGGGIANSGSLSVRHSTISGNAAIGGMGGNGFAGATGMTGEPGNGGDTDQADGGPGGPGTTGGTGGQGGWGGGAYGAGIANSVDTTATATITASTITDNLASAGKGGAGGQGGQGGTGGMGGNGYDAGDGVWGAGGVGGAGGQGGQGGTGGDSGRAYAAGVSNQRTVLLISSTVVDNPTSVPDSGGAPGSAGAVGAGGPGGSSADESPVQASDGDPGDPGSPGTAGSAGTDVGGSVEGGEQDTYVIGSIVDSCSGYVRDKGYNLTLATDNPDHDCGFEGETSVGVVDFGLGALGDHGGSTPTIVPGSDSPAVGKIPSSVVPANVDEAGYLVVLCGTGAATDQRGTARPAPGQNVCATGATEPDADEGSGGGSGGGGSVTPPPVETTPTPAPGCDVGPFPDVAANSPFCVAISWAKKFDITFGYGDGNHHPTSATSRQAMAGFLYRLTHDGKDAGACTSPSPFPDVPTDSPFCAAVTWFDALHISTGYTDGSFKLVAPVSRMAAAAFLYRVTHPGQPGPACTVSPFPDVPVDSPFCGVIAWLKDQRIAKGYGDGSYGLTRAVSRQAMASFLYRWSFENGGKDR